MENQISSDLIRGHIDTIILYSLIDCDKHAQQISDAILSKSNNQYEINQATLYSSLKRLEKMGFVKPYWNDATDGRRRFFKLLEKGKAYIDENLSNWSFSRSIIDKLLNVAPTPAYVVSSDYVSNSTIIDNTAKNEQNNHIESLQNQSTNTVKEVVNNEVKTDEKQQEVPQIIQDELSNSTNDDKTNNNELFVMTSEKEINFRNILNGLVKTTKIIEEEPTFIVEETPKKAEQEKLIDVIQQKSSNEKIISKCNIDFGDLEIKASKEGYKIRFSNAKKSRTKDKIFINCINFMASLVFMLLCILEINIIKTIIDFNATLKIIFYLIGIIPAIVFCLVFVIKTNGVKSYVKSSEVISSIIIFFDFMLLLFVLEWLCGLDFTVTFDLVNYFILPMLLFLNALVFIIIRFSLSKCKLFISKK